MIYKNSEYVRKMTGATHNVEANSNEFDISVKVRMELSRLINKDVDTKVTDFVLRNVLLVSQRKEVCSFSVSLNRNAPDIIPGITNDKLSKEVKLLAKSGLISFVKGSEQRGERARIAPTNITRLIIARFKEPLIQKQIVKMSKTREPILKKKVQEAHKKIEEAMEDNATRDILAKLDMDATRSYYQVNGRIYRGRITTSMTNLSDKAIAGMNPEKKLVNVDMRSCWINLFRAMHGGSVKNDAYSSGEFNRRFIKLATNIVLNTRSVSGAIMALKNEIKQDYQYCESIVDEVVHLNRDVATHFFVDREVHYKLMELESDIMMELLGVCTNENLFIVPKHDGFICDSKDKDYLVDAYKRAIRNVVGTDIPVDVEEIA